MTRPELDKLIDWCRHKLVRIRKQFCSDKYKSGYEDAMKAVMSELHSQKEKSANNQSELIEKLQKELEAAQQCIYAVEHELSKCGGSDYAVEIIEEWEAKTNGS